MPNPLLAVLDAIFTIVIKPFEVLNYIHCSKCSKDIGHTYKLGCTYCVENQHKQK